MNQGDARALAREIGALAVLARLSPTTGKWLTSGWATADSTWIVVTPEHVLYEEAPHDR